MLLSYQISADTIDYNRLRSNTAGNDRSIDNDNLSTNGELRNDGKISQNEKLAL